jgi:biotin carboxyl carrier protein
MSKIAVTIEGRTYTVELPALLGHETEVAAAVDGETVMLALDSDEESAWYAVDGRVYEAVIDSDLRWLRTRTGVHALEVRDLDAIVSRPVTGDGRVKAPIPGLIARILVEIGQTVEIGQPILVLEAMKMQNEIRSPLNGVIEAVHVQPGATVARAQVLIEIGRPSGGD